MEKELYLDRIPDSFKLERLDSGKNGTCYKTSDGRVFKEYHSEGIYDDMTKNLLNFKYDGFTFPEQLIFVNGIFKGYLKQYIEGNTLANIDSLMEIRKLVVALNDFEDSLMDFSYDTGLYVYDLNLHNLIYSIEQNKLYDIDTDPISPFDFPVINPYYENKKELANALASSYMSGEFKSKRLNDLQAECLSMGYSRASLFISEAISEMEKEKPIKTIDDYKKGLVLLRK